MNNIAKNIILTPFNILYKINPELNLKILYRLQTGQKLSLEKPITYNEKLQWIKLYDKNELMPKCCDKYTVREYVESCGCSEILNDLIWEGFDPSDIPFDDLPKQFVIKVTHGSGFNIICNNKDELDRVKTIKQLNIWLKGKFIPCYGEWFYGVIKPRIIIEKFLSDDKSTIPEDYKIMCFHGEPRYIIVDTDRFTHHKRNIYDLNWNLLEGYNMGFDNDNPIEKNEKLEELLEYSRKISKNFKHARIDFYVVDNKIYFGEITFTNGAGFDRIAPHSFNIEMGNWLKLPNEEYLL